MVRVLVVEDNPHVARLIREGLAGGTKRAFGDRYSFEFDTAANGRDALDKLWHQKPRFDALIIDVYLPILDGPAVIRELRGAEALRDTPVIAVSAGGKQARAEALEAGANAFLEKPMRLSEIMSSMQALLDLDTSMARAPSNRPH